MTHKTLKAIENIDLSNITITNHVCSAVGASYLNYSVRAVVSISDVAVTSIAYIVKVGQEELTVYKASEIKPTLTKMVTEQMGLDSK